MSGLSVGFHVSIAESVDLSVDRAKELGCTTFQIFTRNPRGWNHADLEKEEVTLFREKRKKAGFGKVVAHMPYLPNLASPETSTMKRSRASLDEELRRCGVLGVDYAVVHLGSHMGAGSMKGVRNVAEACRQALSKSQNETMILLEIMAGQKNCVGARFEELRLILDSVHQKERIGVCFDTCHAFAAGFDLASEAAVARTMGLFDELVGLDEIRVVHLNDSKGPLGNNLDRHEHIGMGFIGMKGFRALLNHPGFSQKPIIMETPMDEVRDYAADLKVVRGLMER